MFLYLCLGKILVFNILILVFTKKVLNTGHKWDRVIIYVNIIMYNNL